MTLRACGLMDMTVDYGSDDYRFESYRARQNFSIGRKFEDKCLNTKSKFASFEFGFLAVQQRVKFFTNL